MMSKDLLELTKRVDHLETQVRELRRRFDGSTHLPHPMTPAQRGEGILHEARMNTQQNHVIVLGMLQQLGLSGEPIGHEELQRLYREAGFDETQATFSAGIVEMRQE